MRNNLTIFLLLLSVITSAQPNTTAGLLQKAITLRTFLDKQHYAPVQWNDSTSRRLYNRWLYVLDDDKLYFTRDEINVLNSYATKLDDEMKGGTWEFFPKSLQVYKKAVQRADSLQKQLLSKPIDFTKPDALQYPFTDFAASVPELQQRYSRMIKWRILNSIASQLDTAGNIQSGGGLKMPADFAARETKARDKIKRMYSITFKEMAVAAGSFEWEMGNKYLQAIAWCYDPHTSYMNLSEKKNFETALSGFEYSTGMGLQQNDDGNYEVERLEPGGNAWRSGELHKGDIVVSVKKGEAVEKELSEMEEEEVEELMSGNSDEKVELTVKAASGATKKVSLTKEKVTNDEGIVKSYVITGSQKIGYIKLPDFYSRESQDIQNEDDISFDGCANDVSKEIVKLKKDSISGLILDLRYNGGGSMWEAMQLAGIFIDYGPVASVKNREGKIRFLKDPNRGTAYDGPLLVMINGASASASELTSAMLQDYNRALIVGSNTYGKGTAQVVYPMDTAFTEDSKTNYDSYKDFVKVTNKKFYRVNGGTTQWKGVEPDITLPDIFEALDIKESKSASALLPDESKKGMYTALTGIPADMLKEKSNRRTLSDTAFIKVKATISWMQQFYRKLDIPLQWQSYTTAWIKNTALLRQLEELEDSNRKKLPVSNNNFDKEKITFATASGKKLNDKYMEIIAGDAYIHEAYKIMLDWINK